MKKLHRKLALALMLAVSGFIGGLIASPTPILAEDVPPCEQDECERGLFGRSSCEDNSGQSTGCMIEPEGGCSTYGC